MGPLKHLPLDSIRLPVAAYIDQTGTWCWEQQHGVKSLWGRTSKSQFLTGLRVEASDCQHAVFTQHSEQKCSAGVTARKFPFIFLTFHFFYYVTRLMSFLYKLIGIKPKLVQPRLNVVFFWGTFILLILTSQEKAAGLSSLLTHEHKAELWGIFLWAQSARGGLCCSCSVHL